MESPDVSKATYAKQTYRRANVAQPRTTVKSPQVQRSRNIYSSVRPRQKEALKNKPIQVEAKSDYRRYAVAYGNSFAVVEDRSIVPMALQSKRQPLKRLELTFLKRFTKQVIPKKAAVVEENVHRRVRTTAYTHNEADHLIYGRKSALGTRLRYGNVRSAAADWSRYPVGTQFRIKSEPGILYEVDDYGGALVGTGTIDLYKPTFSSMNHWGVRHVDVEVVKWGSFARSLSILQPRKGWSHVRRMVQSIQRKGSTEEARVATLAMR